MADDRAGTVLGERLAGELDSARAELEQLAVQLCMDPVVFGRHPEPLQRFDYVAQIIGEIAGLLRSTAPAHEAIGVVRLEAMRNRLAG